MDSKKFGNMHDNCLGREDIEEDDDALVAYNISGQRKDKPNVSYTGFAVSPDTDDVVFEKNKKLKKKQKAVKGNSQLNETKRQQGMFNFMYDPNEVANSMGEATLISDEVETTVVNSATKKPEVCEESLQTSNNSLSNTTTIQPPRIVAEKVVPPAYGVTQYLNQFQPNSYINLIPRQMYQSPIIPNVNQAPIVNPFLQQRHLSNIPYTIPVIANMPNISMTTSASRSSSSNSTTIPENQNSNPQLSLANTYVQRLQVVEVLFRFILTILRSPEQPSVSYIEYLKSQLDLLITNKSSSVDNPITK